MFKLICLCVKTPISAESDATNTHTLKDQNSAVDANFCWTATNWKNSNNQNGW